MEKKSYPNSGVLFSNERRTSDKMPNFKGEVELDEASVNYLLAQLKLGELAKLELAGWTKTSSKGTQFISLRASTPYVAQSRPAQAKTAAAKAPWD
jgi:uncharacterized protein (DUF736 family)